MLARIAESSEGDARAAITALRVAARKATQEGLEEIPPRLVETSMAAAGREVRQKAISKLNSHQRTAYEVVRDQGPMIQKDLYEEYQRRHDSPVSLRYLRGQYLPKLKHYNLIESELTGEGKRYELIEARC